MKIGTRPLAIATSLLLLFGLVGLLVVDDDAGATRLSTAASATTAQGTARMSMAMSFGAGGTESKMIGEGVVDLRSGRARATLTSPLLPGPMEMVVDGTTVYMATVLPELRAQAGGKPWMAIDASTAAPGIGGNVFGGTDPMQSLRLLNEKGIAGEIRENGTQDVRGVGTTRYVAELDVAKMMATVDSPQAQAMKRLVKDAEGELEVWVDDDDVVRRSVFRMTLPIGSQPFTSTVTTEFFEFGVAVDVTVPPADQVHRMELPTG